jgi:Tol biopolymer transport system component
VTLLWRWAKTPTVLGVCYLVLLSAVMLGVITPGVRSIAPFGGHANLALGGRTRIAPLTQRFIDRVLGPGSSLVSVAPLPAGSGRSGRAGPHGEVVEHELTNDDQADAYPVSRLPFTARSTTTEAGREPGEPACGPQVAGGSVWYRYSAVASERLLADTFTSNYETALAAYRADGDALTQLACDFDTAGNAQIGVPVSAGATYLFQIGAAVRGGDLVFHLDRFGTISLASISTDSRQGNYWSSHPSLSYDGRYVAFASASTNLTPEGGGQSRTCIPTSRSCQNGDIFLRDRLTRNTRLVSITVDGTPANAQSLSGSAAVSDDGRYVAFSSSASNLVEGDTNGVRDVFVRDMTTGRTERVSVTSAGEQTTRDPASYPSDGVFGPDSDYGSAHPVISGDGRYVAFDSGASNLDPRDTNGDRDVFVRDRVSGVTSLVCLDHRDRPTPRSLAPNLTTDGCALEGISRNGRWVVFDSVFSMSADDHDEANDVFVRDLHLGTTERVSGAPGEEAPDDSVFIPRRVPQRSISDDGRFVVFGSDRSNLVPADTNAALDVFVRDRATQRTERVSVSSSGTQGIDASPRLAGGANTGGLRPTWSISGDGRYVAFASLLAGLVPDDADRASDVFLHDRSTKTTIRLSFAGQGSQSEKPSEWACVSGDGHAVAFDSDLTLTDDDENTSKDVFVYQRNPLT